MNCANHAKRRTGSVKFQSVFNNLYFHTSDCVQSFSSDDVQPVRTEKLKLNTVGTLPNVEPQLIIKFHGKDSENLRIPLVRPKINRLLGNIEGKISTVAGNRSNPLRTMCGTWHALITVNLR